jgi:uncharacterized protein (DUF1684 family)
MSRVRLLRATIAAAGFAAVATACSVPPPPPPRISAEDHAAQIQAFRDSLRALRTGPGGPLSWIGLWPLEAGEEAIGSDASLRLRLPASAPARVGMITLADGAARFTPAAGVRVTLADSTAVTGPLALVPDTKPDVTILQVNGLRLRLHGEPSTDRLWLRAFDPQAPAIAAYEPPPAYPVDGTWRVMARLIREESTRTYDVNDVTGGTQQFTVAGTLYFRVQGEDYAVLALARKDRPDLFIPLRDATSGKTTYDAARFLYADMPGSDGWTVLDFNRAHNPPCAFTVHSTCALPPRENILPIAVTAGEQKPEAKRIGGD